MGNVVGSANNGRGSAALFYIKSHYCGGQQDRHQCDPVHRDSALHQIP
jgi:hypothetical protein